MNVIFVMVSVSYIVSYEGFVYSACYFLFLQYDLCFAHSTAHHDPPAETETDATALSIVP